ncbi:MULTISPECIES: PilZ domain-containing protein [unclassified Sphingomonas]|uniref:PilZ domain-containing protein n=1 Tax=unclassified Sphingomonas TaxID=196159 RepID=UPI002150F2BB|nr:MULTISPECIES: PilZ domain-containing protein [unclassified Sphingomonas]MCR5869371.1 PilZ domain-containing protein [Sphingomonas sp. J344]UUX98899.1 PilZ domain-containing protein [Sphingomonas sp. J315]
MDADDQSDTMLSTGADRRSDARITTLFQVARLLTGDGAQHLCLIRNIGPGGMMLEIYAPIEPGLRVRVEPKVCDPITGVVRWAEARQAGIAFNDPIDVHTYLHSHNVLLPDQLPRCPRVTTAMRARLRIGAVWHLVPLIDLSQGGAKVETDLPVELGQGVEIDIEGIGVLGAHVRWVRGERVGLVFTCPLRLALVAQWIATHGDAPGSVRAA